MVGEGRFDTRRKSPIRRASTRGLELRCPFLSREPLVAVADRTELDAPEPFLNAANQRPHCELTTRTRRKERNRFGKRGEFGDVHRSPLNHSPSIAVCLDDAGMIRS